MKTVYAGSLTHDELMALPETETVKRVGGKAIRCQRGGIGEFLGLTWDRDGCTWQISRSDGRLYRTRSWLLDNVF